MKRKVLTLAGISLLTIGLSTSVLNNTIVNAAQVTAGKTAKLTHNAYIYNSKRKRVKKSVLKKNKTAKVIKIVKIKGKTYAQIGKNQFVKLSNLSGIDKSKTKSTKSKTTKKATKTNSSKNDYKKNWSEKLKGLDDAEGYKITALKDTTIYYDMSYDWYETGVFHGEINFPKGSSIYLTHFTKYKQWLENMEIDEGGDDEGTSIDIRDVSLSKWIPPEDYTNNLDDGGLDALVPQTGEYKEQKANGINGGMYSLLGTERELTKRGLFKKVTYDTDITKVLHESDTDYKKDLDAVQNYYLYH